MKIGVRLESLGLPLRKALHEASKLGVGVGGVQLDAAGELGPDRLSQTGRREIKNLLKTHNLELTALGCPLRHGLDTPENLQPRIEHVRKVMTLAFELGPRLVVIAAGKVPGDPAVPSVMTEALVDLGRHGDRTGAVLALETGPEPTETLAKYLARFDSGGLGVNFDPANLLINGLDPYAVAPLAGKIVHAHAKDARKVSPSRAAAEVALGHGDLDWLHLAGAFEEIEYRGWVVVERETAVMSPAEAAQAVGLLRRLG
jgi:sugar phosphate isomerase/epimerase